MHLASHCVTSFQPPEPRAAFKAEREGIEIQTVKARCCICAPVHCIASEHSNLRIASVILHSLNYHIRDCLGDPCVDSRSRSLSQSTPEDFCLLRPCLRHRPRFWGLTHRTRESFASAGSTLMVLVATRKIDPTHGEGLLWKSPISPYLVLGRSSLSRCPSMSGTISVEDLTC